MNEKSIGKEEYIEINEKERVEEKKSLKVRKDECSKEKGISLKHTCTSISMLGRNHTMEFEGQGEIVGKELSLCHEDSFSPFLKPSLLSHEVSYVELRLFLASYISHLSIVGDACSFGGGLCWTS
ncbi:hypothetical protein M9H77_03000 [Catharanthus roseus]|uniref:Uncharacterized protein n=1 Tax=Catharanthus roseus TaxID=4058 RepID=A0ACC0C9Z6_CATRO|nr:hypothetical protein M9H77_03000 [Catharanthus roseus]